MAKNDYHSMLLNAQVEALTSRILLDELRAGRLAVALELLEQRLDTSILMIDSFARKADTTHVTDAVESLQIIRQYRKRYPRKTEAVIDPGEKDDDLTKQKTQEKAKKILDELPDA